MKQRTGLFALIVFALGTAAANDQAADGRALIQAERQDMFRSELHLTDEESEKFWQTYSIYREKHAEIMRRYGELITEYVRRYDDADLSDEYADEMIETYFGIKKELLEVQQEFLPAFREALPSLKVARFYQLENRFNTEIDAQLATVVPLVYPS